MDYKEKTETLKLPANVGLEGVLRILKEVLRRPRLQEVVIDARGSVTYRRLVREGEADPLNLDFADLEPFGVLRNADVEEMLVPAAVNGATAVGEMLDRVTAEHMYPVAFVTGAATVFWDWYSATTGSSLRTKGYIFGLPILPDAHIPDTALLLCAAHSRESALIDTEWALKIEMELEAPVSSGTPLEVPSCKIP